jgi:hypothetical protein
MIPVCSSFTTVLKRFAQAPVRSVVDLARNLTDHKMRICFGKLYTFCINVKFSPVSHLHGLAQSVYPGIHESSLP